MDIVKTRKEFNCAKCRQVIPTGSITLQIVENDMPRAIRRYYHKTCGTRALNEMVDRLVCMK